MITIRVEEPDFHSGPNRTVDNSKQNDHAAVGVVPRIEDQCFQGGVRIALRQWDVAHDRLENFRHPFAGFRAGENRVVCFQTDEVLDLLDRLLGFSTRQVDLIDNWDELEIVLEGEISVRQRLGFNALRSVDYQQRTFTRRE